MHSLWGVGENRLQFHTLSVFERSVYANTADDAHKVIVEHINIKPFLDRTPLILGKQKKMAKLEEVAEVLSFSHSWFIYL